jgi:dTDP-D-glucose 4,6-dehydratase
MTTMFGWEPRTPLEVGIARTVAWYASRSDRPTSPDELEQRLLSR